MISWKHCVDVAVSEQSNLRTRGCRAGMPATFTMQAAHPKIPQAVRRAVVKPVRISPRAPPEAESTTFVMRSATYLFVSRTMTPGTVAGEARGPWVTGTGHGPRRHVMHERGYSGGRGCARTVSSESRWPAHAQARTRTHAGRSSQGRRTGTRCEVVGRGRHAYGQATQAAPCAPCANRYRTFLSRKRIAGLGPSGGGDARAVSIGEPGESIGASGPTARPPQRIPGEKAPRPRPALRHGGPTAPVTSASAGARVAGRGRGQPNTVGAWPACA
jgi:hypothetical protein